MTTVEQSLAAIEAAISERQAEVARLKDARDVILGKAHVTRNDKAATEQPKAEQPKPARANGGTRSRRPSGATRDAVIAAIADARGPVTAGDVAERTGLGRATVSTTMSKLNASGELTKASRGYQLP